MLCLKLKKNSLHRHKMKLIYLVAASIGITIATHEINRLGHATPYYGPGIGTCQDAQKKKLSNARCFDANNEYARYENYKDWMKGKESKVLWPGME